MKTCVFLLCSDLFNYSYSFSDCGQSLALGPFLVFFSFLFYFIYFFNIYMQVLSKDPSLQSWMFSKYKKLCKSSSSKVFNDIKSSLEDVFSSFLGRMDVGDAQVDSDEDDSDPSRFIERAYLVPRFSNQHEACSELYGKDSKLRTNNGSYHIFFLF